ncbi:hypothetical protein Xoosp13_398 [Xanthomonas phage Xoo-sp13]|nr:hypothetical protein Xoosp13_398 [Xanthomonas phage Xoo-sp13]
MFDEVNLGIHTFTNLDDAKVLVSQNSVPRIFELVIVECTIPKGTPFFNGKWISATGPIKSYACESLVLNKIVGN